MVLILAVGPHLTLLLRLYGHFACHNSVAASQTSCCCCFCLRLKLTAFISLHFYAPHCGRHCQRRRRRCRCRHCRRSSLCLGKQRQLIFMLCASAAEAIDRDRESEIKSEREGEREMKYSQRPSSPTYAGLSFIFMRFC